MDARIVDLHSYLPSDTRIMAADLVFQRVESPECVIVHRSVNGPSGVILSVSEFEDRYLHAPNAVRVAPGPNGTVVVQAVHRYVT